MTKRRAKPDAVELERLVTMRINKNKVRLFDLIVRILDMKSRSVTHAGRLEYEVHSNLQDSDFSFHQPKGPGVLFTYAELKQDHPYDRESWETVHQPIRVDVSESDEYKFEFVTDALDKIEAEHQVELEKERKRDAVLRAMSAEDREAIGMGHWKDPDPDGEAKVLASKIVKAKPARSRPRADQNDDWSKVKRVSTQHNNRG